MFGMRNPGDQSHGFLARIRIAEAVDGEDLPNGWGASREELCRNPSNSEGYLASAAFFLPLAFSFACFCSFSLPCRQPPCLRRRKLFLPSCPSCRLFFIGLGGLEFAADQFKDGHLRAVAVAEAEPDDAGVAALALGEARRESLEQLGDNAPDP